MSDPRLARDLVLITVAGTALLLGVRALLP